MVIRMIPFHRSGKMWVVQGVNVREIAAASEVASVVASEAASVKKSMGGSASALIRG
jgi:hypothetical protein